MRLIKVLAPRRERRATRFVAAALALTLPGCSMSIPGFVDLAPTGSARSAPYPFAKEDWAKAKLAVIAAIRAEADADPAPWRNAASGRGGVVVGIGARYAADGATCRAIVTRISEDGGHRDIEAAACLKADEVTVTDAAPFRGV